MNRYFDSNESIFEKQGDQVVHILKTIAGRYMGQNPPHPVTYRAYNRNGIHRLGDYRYKFDFHGIYPLAPRETIVYAWAKLWGDAESDMNLTASAYGPLTVYFNGEKVFKANILNERNPHLKSGFRVRLKKGWNNVVIKFTHTQTGFGGLLGPGSPKSLPLHFLMPSVERDGQEGWLYTRPLKEELAELPKVGMQESETGLLWSPGKDWHEKELAYGQFKRMYSLRPHCYGVGWTRGQFPVVGNNEYIMKGTHEGPLEVYLDEERIYLSEGSGEFSQPVTVRCGKHDILVKSGCDGKDWGFELQFVHGEEPVRFLSPVPVKGTEEAWFYTGPFDASQPFDCLIFKETNTLFQGVKGPVYWRLDQPGTWIRPYIENVNFGKWNYPLGVTLYGLLSAGRVLQCKDTVQYVKEHVEASTAVFPYALWDKEQYGAAGVQHLLTQIDCLDDCGSFGSLMLELAKEDEVRNYRQIADYIAGYMRNNQSRLEDGAFVRRNPENSLMDETLWADDLYMSVPFLCRYYQLTGDAFYVEDAAKQLILYHKYLYRPDLKIMSHVFDFKVRKATEVSWGRGNGWVAFSFSELLAVLPEEHKDRPRLLEIFNELCEGYLQLQDEEGMWHQVLTDFESYPETSCTSMFAYAFARGVRYGWLKNQTAYTNAALKAWEGLSKVSIDYLGNIYGVCRGSGFSFTEYYYKNELSWNLNDTHGTGIVMLAGIEVLNLLKYNEALRCPPCL